MPRRDWRKGRGIARTLLALAYLAAGVLHILDPQPFMRITPNWVPDIPFTVFWTGVVEILGALALLQPWSRQLRRTAGAALAVYAVAVFPANINHLMIDMALADPDLGWGYHAPRMILQPLLVWLALWTGELIGWPFGQPRNNA